MKRLIQEGYRRSLWQVLGIYLVAGWVVLQVADVLAQNMGLPAWVFPFAVLLLVIGLPVVLATAFIQNRRPGPESSESSGPAQPEEDLAEPAAKPFFLFTWRNSIRPVPASSRTAAGML